MLKKNLFILIIFIVACNSDQTNQNHDQQDQVFFFDLTSYFNKEINRLKDKRGFIKSTTINGQVEEQQVDTLNFNQEFKIFLESDINKPAWADKYQVDSISSDITYQISQINYTALEDKLKIKSIQVKFDDYEEVALIEIIKQSNSPIAKTEQTLTSEPNNGFSIRSYQNVAVLNPNEMQVQVQFPN